MSFEDLIPQQPCITGSKTSIPNWCEALCDPHLPASGEVILAGFWSQDEALASSCFFEFPLRGGCLKMIDFASNSNVGVRHANINSSPPKQKLRAFWKARRDRALT